MERPAHLTSGVSHRSWRRILAIGVAVVVEAGAIWTVENGLGVRALYVFPQILNVNFYKHPQPVEPPPPPPPQLVEVKPVVPAVPPPVISIKTPPPPKHAIRVVRGFHRAQPVIGAPAPPPPPQSKTSAPPAPTPPRAIASTHTQPPYPLLARRIGQQGTVLLTIGIDADGNVTDVRVAQSSGKSALDDAAVRWVKAHWRYRPATRNGQPVAAESEARVVFDLQRAKQLGLI